MIDLWQMGTLFMAVTPNGPFGLSVSHYEGDVNALMEAFEAFGH